MASAASTSSRTASSASSPGAAETPGLTILRNAHIDLEGLTLDREVRALRDQFVTINYSKILYNGLFQSGTFISGILHQGKPEDCEWTGEIEVVQGQLHRLGQELQDGEAV